MEDKNRIENTISYSLMIKIMKNHKNYNKYLNGTLKEKEYLNYIFQHKVNIFKAFEKSLGSEHYKKNCDELLIRIINHDLSKLDSEEFEAYRNYFYPEENEEKNKENFSKAWKHHYLNNSHHPEYYKEKEMKKIDILEMILDWESMGYSFNDTAKEFYYSKKKKELIDSDFNIDFEYLELNFFN